MKLLTLMLKELTEINLNFAVPMLFQIWHEFVLKIKLLLLLLASREARKKAA